MGVISELTIDDFKALFARNFPFLPVKVDGKVYFAGDIVYVAPNFYQSLVDENTADVSDTEAWKAVKADVDDYVSDDDIQKAWREALNKFNESLGVKDVALCFLYLVAFYLAYDLSVASAGAYGQISFPVQSQSVGNVSESYYIPQVYAESPILSFYTRNGFGLKYLDMIYPLLIGNVGIVAGWSLP